MVVNNCKFPILTPTLTTVTLLYPHVTLTLTLTEGLPTLVPLSLTPPLRRHSSPITHNSLFQALWLIHYGN